MLLRQNIIAEIIGTQKECHVEITRTSNKQGDSKTRNIILLGNKRLFYGMIGVYRPIQKQFVLVEKLCGFGGAPPNKKSGDDKSRN
ncbi:MAG: hypothetical protein PHO56_05165 [Patescibacteria group bacterium]|nr:hypothetical protein [Patescibacteria group bacterium]